MSIDRELWLRSFGKNRIPNWHCPRCDKGILFPDGKNFQYKETADSRVSNAKLYAQFLELEGKVYAFSENESTISSEFSEYYYSVLLRCNNPSCFEYVISCGYGHVIEEYDSRSGEMEQVEVFRPEYFYPAINLFSISSKCPTKVAKEVKSSFKLFFVDPPASANCVRKAVETILTERKVKRYTTNKAGKKQLIGLHDRIVLFQSRQPEIAQKLFAIKWLGNDGSHTNNTTKNDILDAYEILEVIIDDLYVGYRKSVDKKVAKINKSKRPLHPST